MTEVSLQGRLQETPCHAQSAYDLSQSYLRTDHYQEAIELERSYKGNCGDNVVQLTWAAFEAAKSLRDTKLAESIVSDLIKRDPRDADYRAWRGMLYESKAEWQKAAEDFEQAIRLKPRLKDIPLNLVDAYRQLKEPCKALAAHSRFLSTYHELQKDRDFIAFNRSLQDQCRAQPEGKI